MGETQAGCDWQEISAHIANLRMLTRHVDALPGETAELPLRLVDLDLAENIRIDLPESDIHPCEDCESPCEQAGRLLRFFRKEFSLVLRMFRQI